MPEADQVIVIEAGWTEALYWWDLWRYRELFFFLAWRDILVRYKQTVMGVAWALIRPFLTMVVFTVIFGVVAKIPSNGVPYPILVFAALLPWQLFSNALSECGNSVVGNANLVSKVYFPRMIIPASAVIVGLIDFMISLVFLGVLMGYYSYVPSLRILALPVFTLAALLVAGGAGLWLASLTVKYRDFRHIVPFIIQFGSYVSPVGFSSAVIPEKWRLLYSLNPMVGVIDGFRWCILGNASELDGLNLLSSALISILILSSGIWYFRRTERTFVDVI